MQADRTEIKIYDYINKIDLNNYHLGVFDPMAYYITSGHAIWKTEKLRSDLCELRKKVLKQKKTKIKATKLSELSKAMIGANKLLNELIELQGSAIFMELEWGPDRQIYVIPKNPRSSKEVE